MWTKSEKKDFKGNPMFEISQLLNYSVNNFLVNEFCKVKTEQKSTKLKMHLNVNNR